jgi:glycosyltransferase involved in cell wall biosynthesis
LPESVSAVICNYNGATFLAEAIESVLGQGSRLLEVIVVDDGSTDDSAARAAPYLNKILWLPLAHAGQASALAEAIKLCRGRWVAFLESDDAWLPGKLDAVMAILDGNPGLAGVQHSMRQVDAALKPLPTWLPPRSRRQTLGDFLSGDALLTGLSALTARRADLLDLLPFPSEIMTCVDEYLQPRLLRRAPIEHVARPLGLRRIHGRNFYAGIAQDPSRLEAYLSLRAILDSHLSGFLESHGMAMAPAASARKRRRDLEMELLLHRLRGDWAKALSAWASILRLVGWRPYALFKAASLALALASPSLYSLLARAYESRPLLARLRGILFK